MAGSPCVARWSNCWKLLKFAILPCGGDTRSGTSAKVDKRLIIRRIIREFWVGYSKNLQNEDWRLGDILSRWSEMDNQQLNNSYKKLI